jgi:hypothetical protein
MTTSTRQALLRLSTLGAALGGAALLSACVVEAPPRRYVAPAPVYQQPAPAYQQPAPTYPQPAPAYEPAQDDQDEPVVSVYVEPPLEQPEPIAVQWAPPPMLVEVPPMQPYPDYVWTGGYWAWEGRWVWAAGRWSPPPRPYFTWVQPYYEHRGEVVVFVPGFWCAPRRHFVPPPPGLSISVAVAAPGLRFYGHAPMGPQGVFVPPPPGSRHGIIVPAPVGTPPAVVVSAPAVVNVGMRVRGNVDVNSHNTVNNVTNVTNVTVEAPAGSTANGQVFQNSVPARAHLAAQLAPAGRPVAPQPVSNQAVPVFHPGQAPVQLPPAQPMRGGGPDRGATAPGSARPGRPEFDQPPRQAAPVNGQPPAWQQGQQAGQPQQGQQPNWQQRPGYGQPAPGQPVQPGQPQGPQPAWQQGQQRQPGQGHGQPQQGQPPYPGQPQPVPQGQAAQPQGQPPAWQRGQERPPGQGNGQPPQGQPQYQGQPQPAPQGQPQQGNPQDQRRRGGSPQGGNPQGQPAPQGGGQPPVQAQPPAQPREAHENANAQKDERKKAPHERQEDRDKKNGERDR